MDPRISITVVKMKKVYAINNGVIWMKANKIRKLITGVTDERVAVWMPFKRGESYRQRQQNRAQKTIVAFPEHYFFLFRVLLSLD